MPTDVVSVTKHMQIDVVSVSLCNSTGFSRQNLFAPEKNNDEWIIYEYFT